MAAAAAGGEENFRERPCVAAYSSPMTPLRFTRYNDGIVEAVALGVPIICAGGAMMGATSPATLAGSISLIDAEALFGVVFAQMIKPGSPVVFAPQTNVMDMVTAQATFGSPEQSLARAAAVQMARYYGLPTFATGGGSDAKLPDGQAAAEATMGMMINAMSGQTLTQNLGTLASGLYGAPEMLVICDEIVHMIKCVFGGLKVTDDTLALDVIREVGPGGTFLSHEHTASSFRTNLFFPTYFPRVSVEGWKEKGSMTITEVAHKTVGSILAQAGPVMLPPGADSALERALREAISEDDAIGD
jgi:trimethylamine--corrinoid protein Co-methyltransferase